ncbi:MAG: glycosyltransferase [Phycisphaerales bacterium]|nr:MAG: glycosyltransferase [Phycisphaerales bacterium]
MSESSPRVSVLIPNYNNGRESSESGRRDFIGDLLKSLRDTLIDDPTPVEIIITDDGSTDDSLATCREWATQKWRGWRGEGAFCRLIEMDHCGVLSIVANRLMSEARGEICVRLDGDVVIHTPNWAEKLVEVFEAGPSKLGIVGPKQLSPNGFVHSAGDWVLHPRGYHHLGQGIAADYVTRAIEVDHVMGCFYCFKRDVWEEVGRYDETILRGQTVDFGLRARMKGWRCFCTPVISFTHYHSERKKRANVADTDPGMAGALDRFREKWGFDRLAPDLDAVAERYSGTPLLWNARWFSPALPWPPPQKTAVPRTVESTTWGGYGSNEALRQAMDARVHIALETIQSHAPGRRAIQVNCRDGLLCHLLAKQGIECIGVDGDPTLLDVARQMAGKADYPAGSPKFVQQIDARCLPVEDRSVDAVLLFDDFERHPNPIGLLREVWRVLDVEGVMAILTPERPNPLDADVDCLHPYRAHELNTQLRYSRLFEVVHPAESSSAESAGGGGMLFVIARRPDPAKFGIPQKELVTTQAAG